MKSPTPLANGDEEPKPVAWTGNVGEGNRAALRALAERAVISLQNARQAEGLQEASARLALAWIRIGHATLLHDVRGYIGMIHNELYLLQNAFAEQVKDPVLISPLVAAKEAVEQLSIRLWELSEHSEDWDTISSIRINHSLILNRAEQIKGRRLEDVLLRRRCELKDDATVRANAYWLNRAIDILLSNAVEATENETEREVWLWSQQLEGWVEIYIEDNGVGFSEELFTEILRGRVQHPHSRGLGVGLMLASAMVQAYGGQIRCAKRNPRGTSMIIFLPLEGNGRDEAENPIRG
jgi:two-component system, NtrC family, C4-dicarboxylate transport sensor histidine kinase DctB